jgi:signal transduction histidine kinase
MREGQVMHPSPAEGTWQPAPPRPEWRITLGYFLAATAWVLLSDRAVGDRIGGRELPAQTVKGLNFVLTTAVLLFFVLRRSYQGWRRAERRNRELAAETEECLRLLCRKSESAREEERAGISRELHDRLGQGLTGLMMDLRQAERLVEQAGGRDLNALTDRLVAAGEQVRELTAQVRNLAADLRPGVLDHLGLAGAIEHEAKRFSSRAGIPCRVALEQLPRDLPPGLSLAAFRIVQEALTNVARHAAASRVDLVGRVDGGEVVLSVADDGAGMQPGAATGRHALGLLGMRERAALCGGRIELGPRQEGGTEVTVLLPWRNPATS